MGKLKNKRLADLSDDDRKKWAEFYAREAAKEALYEWYETAHVCANAEIRHLQIQENLEQVSAIDGWMEKKGERNGYVMLTNLKSGNLKPVTIELDDYGRITYSSLHKQIRRKLELNKKESLRLIPFRPWFRYMSDNPYPEDRVIPATHDQCTQLLGTTLLYLPYVHLKSAQEQPASDAVAPSWD